MKRLEMKKMSKYNVTCSGFLTMLALALYCSRLRVWVTNYSIIYFYLHTSVCRYVKRLGHLGPDFIQ